MSVIKVKTLDAFDAELPMPKYETKDAAGADLRACFPDRADFIIKPGKRVLVPTGLSFEIEPGYEVQVRPRSGLSLKTNLLVVNSPGTIDADYRGEVMIILGNFGDEDEIIKHGDRIAQMVISPITQATFEVVNVLSDTERGAGGFGSTGIN
jgi:dUTP pyrophosphatase